MCQEMTHYPKIILNEGRNTCFVGHVCYICSHISIYLYSKPCQNLSSWHHFLDSIWTWYLYLHFKGGVLTSRSYIGRSWGRTIQLLFLMLKDPKKHFAIFCDKLYFLNKLSTFNFSDNARKKRFFCREVVPCIHWLHKFQWLCIDPALTSVVFRKAPICCKYFL